MDAYANEATRQALEQDRPIRRSIVKLAVYTVVFGSLPVLVLFLIGRFALTSPTVPYYPLLGALLFLAIILYRIVPPWLGVGRPVLVLSKAGIAVGNGAPIPWAGTDITWEVSRSSGIAVASAIVIEPVGGKRKKIEAMTLAISQREFLRLCSLYSTLGVPS